ncbi:hypothetical protein LIER_27543 [Lithospermum erythrorhizon]|uniref:Uncharacterized protein n=1 Tax=Lithospermum erythrorhizon TaxID=34254 RepID=A0AAV3RGJ4_LITER
MSNIDRRSSPRCKIKSIHPTREYVAKAPGLGSYPSLTSLKSIKTRTHIQLMELLSKSNQAQIKPSSYQAPINTLSSQASQTSHKSSANA